MRILAPILWASTLAAQTNAALHLQAVSGTTAAVQLAWTGASGSCRLERKNEKSEWPAIATTPDGKASDTSIAPYGTYTYRATCDTKSSNEVTVGPPPAGFHLIAPKPEQRPDPAFGRWISVAPDSNGDPSVAFVYADPNGDGNSSDTQVMFAAWDRAAYRWKEPVIVGTAANFDPRPPLSNLPLARDPQTGTLGTAWVETDNKTMTLALSRDGGATWNVRKAITGARPISAPSMVFAAGKVYLALASDDNAGSIRYYTGAIEDDPAKWLMSVAPIPPAALATLRASSLALDSTGAPALAYWSKPKTGSDSTLLFWRPGAPLKVIAGATTAGYPADGVLLAFQGTQPRVIVDARFEKGNIPTHYSLFSNDGGETWSKPALIPDDGNERIGGFMSLALGPGGHAAFAGDVLGGNTGGMRCSWPKLARTADFASWTTCAPQGGLKPDARTNFGNAWFSPGGMLYLVFQNRGFSPTQDLKPGLMIWGGR